MLGSARSQDSDRTCFVFRVSQKLLPRPNSESCHSPIRAKRKYQSKYSMYINWGIFLGALSAFHTKSRS